MPTELPAAELLYRRAERCHRERHQGCADCEREHCVFFSVWDGREEYRCYECGFCVSHDRRTARYQAFREEPDASDVLSDDAPDLLEHLEDHPALRATSLPSGRML